MKKILLILSVIALANCAKTEESFDEMSTTKYDENIITIDVAMNEEESAEATKGYIVWTPQDMATVSLYCERCDSGETWSSSSRFTHMNNEELVYEDGEWVYEDEPVAWGWESATDRYSFYGYSPYPTDDNGLSSKIVDGNLVIDYTVPTDCKTQPDLTYATPRKDIFLPAGGLVYLDFDHALSLVSFQLRNTKADFIDPNKRIKKITINSVSSRGTFTVDIDGNAAWSYVETPAIFSADGNLKVKPTRTEQSVTTDGNYLMMIPQTLTYTTEVFITLAHELGGCEEVKSFYLPAGTTWEAGQSYSYVVDDDSNIVFERGSGSTADFSNCSSFSNCYMLHPSATEEVVYYIPVDERINEFWEYYATTDESAYNEAFLISDSYGASGEVVWHDCVSLDGFNVEILDTDNDDFPTPNAYPVSPAMEPNYTTPNAQVVMKVTIPANFNHGNISVALWRDLDGDGVVDKATAYDDNGDIVALNETFWSWHFWVTDYDPDGTHSGTNAYRQNVTGGTIQRYTDDASLFHNGMTELWDGNGIYHDKYIMDRNLGATAEGLAGVGGTSYGKGFVVYQFGRKDPFPGSVYTEGTNYQYELGSSSSSDGKYFSDAVHNPFQFFNVNANWANTAESAAYSLRLLWNDINMPNDYPPTVDNNGYNLDLSSHVSSEGDRAKSIFDPSPLGWRLPIHGVWSDFVVDVDPDTGEITDSMSKFQTYSNTGVYVTYDLSDGNGDPYAGNYGTRIYSHGDCTPNAQYSIVGYKTRYGELASNGTYGYCRTASPSIQNESYDGVDGDNIVNDETKFEITDFAYLLCMDGWGVKDNYPYVRGHGMQVRSIQE